MWVQQKYCMYTIIINNIIVCTAYLLHFSPETLLQSLLDLLEGLLVLERVEMCEDTHHLGEAMGLQDVQELKCLHFKSKTGIN